MLEEKPDKVAPKEDKNSSLPPSNSSGSEELTKLRSLLLGDDYENVIKERLSKENIDRVAEVLSEAFQQRNKQDDSLAQQMSPVIESAIDTSIKAHPERITNVIFPIIGPAVRKAVSSALSDLMQSLNHLLQQSLTARALVWRFKAWRLGIPYGQYALLQSIQFQVEQVFLIHRETGLLLQSACIQGIEYQDPDLVSSMLTAISDFANDSFNQENNSLNVIKFGDLSLLIETGPHAIVAFAVRGTIPSSINIQISELLEKIHLQFNSELIKFNGDSDPFLPCHDWLIDSLVRKEKEQQPSKPWLAIILVLAITTTASYYLYNDWQDKQTQQSVVQNINQQSGFQVIEHNLQDKRLSITVLRSPLAISTNQLIESFATNNIQVVITEKIAMLDDPELFISYLSQKYQASLTVNRLQGEYELLVSDKISVDNFKAMTDDILVMNYFKVTKHPSLVLTSPPSARQLARQEFIQLTSSINNQFYYFESAKSQLE